MNWQSISNDREKYAAYLCSREWAVKRDAVRARNGGMCERCHQAPMNHVHHLTYIRKYRERLEDLQGICLACHEYTHNKSDVDPLKSPVRIDGILSGTENGSLDLERLNLRVVSCTRCKELVACRTRTVFGNGPIGATVFFIGEAPGTAEDQQGIPFVGDVGGILNKIIAACGLNREEVYLCNIIKCRPPGNRSVMPYEAENCREYLEEQLRIVRPKFICCLGVSATSYLLRSNRPFGQMRGQVHNYNGAKVIVTYHPAYLLPYRNPAKHKDVWEDMKLLLSEMGRPAPDGGFANSV